MPEYDGEMTVVRPVARPRASDRKRISAVLNQHDILGVLGETHVLLRPSVPFVSDRGWFELYGSWQYFPKPPRDYAASAARDLAQLDRVGPIDFWFVGLTPGAQYIAAIDVSGAPHYPGPALFQVESAGGLQATSAKGNHTLLVPITADDDRCVVKLSGTNMSGYLFYQAELFRMNA